MKSLKILFIGNSFAVDTMEHTADIALSLGVESLKFCTLYVGGCSIDMHYTHATEDLPVYKLYTNVGEGWTSEPDVKIKDTVLSDEWDLIAIQHGTNNGARYTSPECYNNLTPLIEYVKKLAPNAKIAFNLTWMGESTRQHHEIISYKGNIKLMREKLVEVTRDTVLKNPYLDLFIPTGTAIENARTSNIGLLTRDCYHLSMDKGRYIAGLTFIAAVTELPFYNIEWAPEGVDEYAKAVAIESAKNALNYPLEIKKSEL